MGKSRFEAFSDGVMAIILTIMVLELKVPKQPTLGALAELWPIYLAYAIAFGNVLANWIAHHHLFAQVDRIDARILLVNGALLFFMSLVPFALDYGSEFHWREPLPAAFYGAVMVAVCVPPSGRSNWASSPTVSRAASATATPPLTVIVAPETTIAAPCST